MKERCAVTEDLNRYMREQDKADARAAYEEQIVEDLLAKAIIDDDVYEAMDAIMQNGKPQVDLQRQMADAAQAGDLTELGRLFMAAMQDNRRQRAEAWAADYEEPLPF